MEEVQKPTRRMNSRVPQNTQDLSNKMTKIVQKVETTGAEPLTEKTKPAAVKLASTLSNRLLKIQHSNSEEGSDWHKILSAEIKNRSSKGV